MQTDIYMGNIVNKHICYHMTLCYVKKQMNVEKQINEYTYVRVI